eukprot:Clim_evm6s63 gene=Clim_evmTU6s63
MAARIWQAYNGLALRQPLLANCMTAGTLMAAGDILTQSVEARGPWDAKRTLNLSFFGACVYSPVFFASFKYLDRRFPGTSPRAVACKVASIALVSAPLINTSFFAFAELGDHILRRKPADYDFELVKTRVMRKWSTDLYDVIINSTKVWVPFNTFNFLLAPPHLRVAFSSVVALMWNAYLSLVQYRLEMASASTQPGAVVVAEEKA